MESVKTIGDYEVDISALFSDHGSKGFLIFREEEVFRRGYSTRITTPVALRSPLRTILCLFY